MFASWRKQGRGPIGLDIGSHSIKMVQLEHRESGWVGTAAASRALPPGLAPSGPQRADAIAQVIRAMRVAGRFAGNRVVSCLPAAAVQYKNLRLPAMPPDEMAGAIQWEAAERLKMGADTMQVQFFDAGEVRQGEETRHEIIVLAASRAAIDDHLDTLLRSDLRPDAIDAVPAALARSISPMTREGDQAATQVVLDVGYSSSKVLITERGRVVFFKLIDIGGQRLDQTVAQALNLQISDAADLRRRLQVAAGRPAGGGAGAGAGGANADHAADGGLLASPRRESVERAVFEAVRLAAGDLTKEVGLCLRYYSVTFRGQRPQVLRLVGGEAHEPQLVKMLSEGAGIEVAAAQPSTGVDLSGVLAQGQTPGTWSEWAVAVGLALRPQAASTTRSAA